MDLKVLSFNVLTSYFIRQNKEAAHPAKTSVAPCGIHICTKYAAQPVEK